MTKLLRGALIACALFFAVPALAMASVSVGQPFPTNLLTVPDATQLTGLRVNLPKPDCTARPSDCQDIDVLNTYDGFNVDARISIPFTGAIDPSTVNGNDVFLSDSNGNVIPLVRFVWTPATNTLHGNPAVYLKQDTTYVLIVTNGVKAADGSHIVGTFRDDLAHDHSAAARDYRARLLRALHWAHVDVDSIVGASLFTTSSITAILEKVRAEIKGQHPHPASFLLGSGSTRTYFPLANVSTATFTRQTGTAPTFAAPASIKPIDFFTSLGAIAFGKYSSPNYEDNLQVIPAVGTKTGVPAIQNMQDVYFNVYLPAGAEPAGGWPVAIFGHGFGSDRFAAPAVLASKLAQRGIALLTINVVGHGGGPLGTVTVTPTVGSPVTFPAGGRGIDQNGDGQISTTEGSSAAPPFTITNSRDGLRQTVIDLMQLVREVQMGMDVDGNGSTDLDASKISYFGQSFGGIYGTDFIAVEPDVLNGVLNVPGGSIPEIARLSPVFRPLVAAALAARTPSLLNGGVSGFTENIPLTGDPIRIDTVPGADAIQVWNDWAIWAQTPADPAAYARYLRMDPLSGVPAKNVIIQFAKGDMTVPNPTATAIIKSGGLEDRATFFRNDLAFANVPGYTVKNPHTFLTNVAVPAQANFAFAAQEQIATFFASGGATTIDPDGAGPFFETPIVLPLPEQLNYIP